MCVRLCRQNHVSSSNDVKKDPFRFLSDFFLPPVQLWTCTLFPITAHIGFSPTVPWTYSVDLLRVVFLAVRQNSWNPLQSDGFMDSRTLANDVYGFHAWQSECLSFTEPCKRRTRLGVDRASEKWEVFACWGNTEFVIIMDFSTLEANVTTQHLRNTFSICFISFIF